MTKRQKPILSYQLQDPAQPRLEWLHLVLKQKNLKIENVLLDTGFDSDLALPFDYALIAGVTEFESKQVEYANGMSELINISKGEILFAKQKLEIEICWLENTDETLLGSGFLSKYLNLLSIDYEKSIISLSLKQNLT